MKVIKRDGTIVAFDSIKIEGAIQKAIKATEDSFTDVATVMADIMEDLNVIEKEKGDIPIEDIQDSVEVSLMSEGWQETARAYILYREERARIREKRLKPDITALSEYIHHFKYARFLLDKQRHETYLETSHRCRDMHLMKFCGDFSPHLIKDGRLKLYDLVMWAWDFVDSKKVLPSMRSMQFGGVAIEDQNCRMYNCSFTLVDRPRVFQEIFYLLLCGCGVGFSVQFPHVDKLPKIKVRDTKVLRHYSIGDSITGWADSIGVLMDSFFSGYYVEFNYAQIRQQGSPLHISGGKAPGHFPLKKLHEIIKRKLSVITDRVLRPIECHDIICHIADSVLSGGIRRSSLISLFSVNDEEMLYSKMPEHFEHYGKNTQRALANNSAVLLRIDGWGGVASRAKEQFLKIMELNKNNPNGEPGFFFSNNIDYGCNPCGEIGLYPVLDVKYEDDIPNLHLLEQCTSSGQIKRRESGIAFCNLTEINCAVIKTEEEFYDAARAAAIIGTLQAAYTDMPYLGDVTKQIVERDALLGVSLTGMMDNPFIALHDVIQEEAALHVQLANEKIARLIGINLAKRLTTVKPSGTASLLLGGVGSGIHPHHSRRYFRRITVNILEPIAKQFILHNPQMVEYKPNGDISLVFPVEAPTNGVVLDDCHVREFLSHVFSTYKHWVMPGTVDKQLGLTHNISCTTCFKPEEYDDMVEVIWRNRESISSMSFIPWLSDKLIPFMPREAVIDEKDEILWNELVEKYKPIDYSSIVEGELGSGLVLEMACTKDDDQCGVISVHIEDTVELVIENDSQYKLCGEFQTTIGEKLYKARRK